MGKVKAIRKLIGSGRFDRIMERKAWQHLQRQDREYSLCLGFGQRPGCATSSWQDKELMFYVKDTLFHGKVATFRWAVVMKEAETVMPIEELEALALGLLDNHKTLSARISKLREAEDGKNS